MTFQLKSKGPLYSGTDKSLTYIRVEINKRKKSVNVTGITPIYKDIPLIL